MNLGQRIAEDLARGPLTLDILKKRYPTLDAQILGGALRKLNADGVIRYRGLRYCLVEGAEVPEIPSTEHPFVSNSKHKPNSGAAAAGRVPAPPSREGDGPATAASVSKPSRRCLRCKKPNGTFTLRPGMQRRPRICDACQPASVEAKLPNAPKIEVRVDIPKNTAECISTPIAAPSPAPPTRHGAATFHIDPRAAFECKIEKGEVLMRRGVGQIALDEAEALAFAYWLLEELT